MAETKKVTDELGYVKLEDWLFEHSEEYLGEKVDRRFISVKCVKYTGKYITIQLADKILLVNMKNNGVKKILGFILPNVKIESYVVNEVVTKYKVYFSGHVVSRLYYTPNVLNVGFKDDMAKF